MSTTAMPINENKGKKLGKRVSAILSMIHRGDIIDKQELASTFSVSLRTIERDLGERLHGIAECKSGQWQLVQSARSTIPARHLYDYARLAGAENLFPDGSLRYLLTQLEIPEARRSTQVKPVAHEDLRSQGAVFSLLQIAIEQQRICHFAYKTKSRQAKPYRLINKAGIWYLAAEEAGRLKNFSVALISELRTDDAHSFVPNPGHQAYIDGKDDVWFTPQTTEVLLRVAPEVAHYFTRRALLPQQQQRADVDGSLLVSTHINHMNQLLPVVRYWLPNVRIVQPSQWHEALLESLRQALAKWDDGTATSAMDASASQQSWAKAGS